MCTQDIIIYWCKHNHKGEIHPCRDKQASPQYPCLWEIYRKLELRQRCKECITTAISERPQSNWCYEPNSAYQEKAQDRCFGNGNAKHAEPEHVMSFGTNFTCKFNISETKVPDLAQWAEENPERSSEGVVSKQGIFGRVGGQEAKLLCKAQQKIYRGIALQDLQTSNQNDCWLRKGQAVTIFFEIDAECWWGINAKTMSRGLMPKCMVEIVIVSTQKWGLHALRSLQFERDVLEDLKAYSSVRVAE